MAETATRRKSQLYTMRRLLKLLRIAVIVLCVALVGVIITNLFLSAPDSDKIEEIVEEGVFLDGVTVSGMDVSGLSYDAARALIMPVIVEQANSISLTVKHETMLWLLSASDMDARANVDDTLAAAIACGRDGSYVENQKVRDDVAQYGREYTVSFTPDADVLKTKLEAIAAVINTEPVDPYAIPDANAETPTFSFHEGADGYLLDVDALAAEITDSLSTGTLSAVFDPELKLTSPAHDVEWVMANTKERATFQTSFKSSHGANRVGNIQKATTLLNGCRVDSGTMFNFNAFIGPRTEKGGWPLAEGIVNGNTYELQAGGGICQVSTTLYNALLCARAGIDTSIFKDIPYEEYIQYDMSEYGDGLLITERFHHSWPSTYADYGLDATVTGSAESGKSLNFINNTGSPIFIFAYCDQENYTMTIHIYGVPFDSGVSYMTRGETIETIEPEATKYVEDPTLKVGEERVDVKSRKGYKAKAWRDTYMNGTAVEGDSELLYTDSYSAKQGVTYVPTGDPRLLAAPPA